MFKEELKEYVRSNPKLVRVRDAGDGISVLKYSKRVFYDNLWNRYLEECRGTIVDHDFNVVSYPFTKIYNYGVESKAPVFTADHRITAYRKVNGFMAAMTWHNGRLLVSTTGSTDSNYVRMVEELMGENRHKFERLCETFYNFTWMFECVHRNDPHIVPEVEGLYLLGWRKKEWGSQVEHDPKALIEFSEDLGLTPVEGFETTVGELLELVKTVRHEGFVFYDDAYVAAKIKSPYYLTSKFMARNPDTSKLMGPNAKQRVEEEYYPLLDAIRNNIESFTALDEQGRLSFIREFLEYSYGRI